MNDIRRGPGLTLLLLFACLCAACGDRGEAGDIWEGAAIRKAKARGKLIVAMDPSFPPFESTNERGEIEGFDVDLARELAKELGVDLELKAMEWDGVLAAVPAGLADVAISGMTATTERALKLTFTAPYLHATTCLLVSNERAPDVTGIVDLDQADRVIAVHRGTTGQMAAERLCPNAEIKAYPKIDQAVLEVAQGRADALIYDRMTLEDLHARHTDTTRLIPDALSREPYAIACRKGDLESVRWIELALHHMRLDGRLAAIARKHGVPDDHL